MTDNQMVQHVQYTKQQWFTKGSKPTQQNFKLLYYYSILYTWTHSSAIFLMLVYSHPVLWLVLILRLQSSQVPMYIFPI